MARENEVVLVTGGTGFIGSHLTEALSRRGAEIRLLLRRTSSTRWIESVSYRPILADLSEGDEGLKDALDGVDTVYHLAGVLRAARRIDYIRGNVEGTRRLVAAARAQKRPPRVVVLSSLAAAGPSRSGRPLTERDDPRPEGPYAESKLLAEKAAREEADGVPLVILRPPMVYGPRERDFLGACRSTKMGLRLHLGRGERTLSLIHVRDLVDGIIEAGERAEAGMIYFVSHPEILTWDQILTGVAEALGRRGMRFVIPEGTLPFIARLGEIVSRLTGKESLINRERTLEWRHRHWVCGPGLAERDWGFRARIPYGDGVRETLEWYQESGWL